MPEAHMHQDQFLHKMLSLHILLLIVILDHEPPIFPSILNLKPRGLSSYGGVGPRKPKREPSARHVTFI